MYLITKMEIPVSLKDNSREVEDHLDNLQKGAREYRKMIDSTRAEIVSMENSVSLATEDAVKSLFPQIEELMADLHREVKQQAVSNENLQK